MLGWCQPHDVVTKVLDRSTRALSATMKHQCGLANSLIQGFQDYRKLGDVEAFSSIMKSNRSIQQTTLLLSMVPFHQRQWAEKIVENNRSNGPLRRRL